MQTATAPQSVPICEITTQLGVTKIQFVTDTDASSDLSNKQDVIKLDI